jgi:hypothetical protein
MHEMKRVVEANGHVVELIREERYAWTQYVMGWISNPRAEFKR